MKQFCLFGLGLFGLLLGSPVETNAQTSDGPTAESQTLPATTRPQRLYVWNSQGSVLLQPTYAEYSLPNLKLVETSVYFSFSTQFDVFKGPAYFANEGAMYRLPRQSGSVAAVKLFGAPNAGNVSVDGTGRLYAVDLTNHVVEEYTPGA